MAIIVEDKISHNRYLLIGAGLGMYKSVNTSIFGGDLFPYKQEGEIRALAVCDNSGDIFFIESSRLQVVKIDGKNISDLKAELGSHRKDWDTNAMGYDICPSCQEKIKPGDKECSYCGQKKVYTKYT